MEERAILMDAIVEDNKIESKENIPGCIAFRGCWSLQIKYFFDKFGIRHILIFFLF